MQEPVQICLRILQRNIDGTVFCKGGLCRTPGGGNEMMILKLLLKVVAAPVVVLLTLFVWICVGLVYVSGMVLGLISMVIVLLGIAVLIYLFATKRSHSAVDRFPHWSVWLTQIGLLAAGKSTGFEIRHSGQGVRII